MTSAVAAVPMNFSFIVRPRSSNAANKIKIQASKTNLSLGARPSLDYCEPFLPVLRPSLDCCEPPLPVLRPSFDCCELVLPELRPSFDCCVVLLPVLSPSFDFCEPFLPVLRPAFDCCELFLPVANPVLVGGFTGVGVSPAAEDGSQAATAKIDAMANLTVSDLTVRFISSP